MLAELAAANAAFGVIKSFISNGKELASCGKQISDFVFAKEQIDRDYGRIGKDFRQRLESQDDTQRRWLKKEKKNFLR